ncbi:MAG: VWA-like domain-containing protein [Porphyromonas sp.]|nr:VWA-like domain-containing protein [Porphyromonas sp.]
MLPEVRQIVDRWYLSEGALFQTFVSHNFEANLSISCPFRCGRGKVEYNPMIVTSMPMRSIELHLKAEMIRILLKHPYERQPVGCKRKAVAMGSNLVLADNYEDFTEIGMSTPEMFDLEAQESFEWYAHRVQEMYANQELDLDSMSENPTDKNSNSDNTSGNEGEEESNLSEENKSSNPPENVEEASSSEDQKREENTQSQDRATEDRQFELEENKAQDISELWEEDPTMGSTIEALIEEIQASNEWGSLAGAFARHIIANTQAKVDYRKVLAGFRASILSTKRQLTRMRPNRRTGFDNMGSMRRYDTRLLVAVDVSASIGEASIRHFYSVINRFFKYGIEAIDVVQFDTTLSAVESIKKKQIQVKVMGFGGTSFQPLFDYVGGHPEYNGLIIFTDGDAPIPTLPKHMKCKVIWVCNTQRAYNVNHNWMKKIGRCCAMEI